MIDTVKIYVTMGCPFCQKLMAWLDKYKVPHERVVFDTTAAKMAFYNETGTHTVPQIYLNEERVGGWSDLQDHEFKHRVETNFTA